MRNRLLLPASFGIIGLVLFLLSLALFIAWNYYEFEFRFLDTGSPPAKGGIGFLSGDENLTNECVILGALTGLIFIAFARDRHEDERITMIRLQSLQLSHYLSYIAFSILLFFVNGISFLVAMSYLPYLFLVIFIIVFYFRLYLLPKFAQHEK
jgi:hypothetical protein